MKKIFNFMKYGLIAIGLSSTANAADLSEILSSGVVKIAVPESFPPFGSVGASGSTVGASIVVSATFSEVEVTGGLTF